MTVKQLIAKLSTLPPGALVVSQKDGEGNGYSPLADLDLGVYRADSTWSGERKAPEDREPGDKTAVFLSPVS
jgi:hypothetical protein